MTSHQPIGVGLIGYGKAGRVFHAPLIESVSGLSLKTIVQRHPGDAGKRHPATEVVRDPGSVFDDAEIALVVVATPNDSHFELGRRALLAGKHVVIDKPFTVTSDEAGQLIDLAAGQHRILTAFHNRRFDGDFLTIRHLIEEKSLGRIVSFEGRFDRLRSKPRPGAWQDASTPGSGVLYDLGSHLIDQALVLFGIPNHIIADVRIERDFGSSDDAFDLWLDYPRLKVALGAGMLVRERTPRFTLRGTEGTFVKYGVDPQEGALGQGATPRDAGWGREPREQWGTLITDRGEEIIETLPGSYESFYENVRDAIAGRALLHVQPEQARTTIEIIEAAARSSRERSSVTLW
jgi:scyllo-inositol 2-dehydrogenase (NADP+)